MPQVQTNHRVQPEAEAQVWAASLPAPLGAHEMAQLAPDITKQIASVWSDACSTSELIEQLLVGELAPTLPYEVASGLLRLYEYNARCRANDAPETSWELPAERLRRTEMNNAI